MVVVVVVVEEEEEEEGGRRRTEGRPPPRPPRAVAGRVATRERGRERTGEWGGNEKFPEGESGARVYICSTGFAREAAEASKINLERRGGRRSRF